MGCLRHNSPRSLPSDSQGSLGQLDHRSRLYDAVTGALIMFVKWKFNEHGHIALVSLTLRGRREERPLSRAYFGPIQGLLAGRRGRVWGVRPAVSDGRRSPGVADQVGPAGRGPDLFSLSSLWVLFAPIFTPKSVSRLLLVGTPIKPYLPPRHGAPATPQPFGKARRSRRSHSLELGHSRDERTLIFEMLRAEP